MPFPETIETARLVLRKPIFPDDAPRIFASYASDPAVTRYVTWVPHRGVEESTRILRTRLAWWDDGREYSWVIIDRGTGDLLGLISINGDGTLWRYSLGYVLARAHWGRGIMREAAGAVLAATFAHPGVERVWAVVDVENAASVRVLEHIGMQREGLLRRWSVHPAFGPQPRDCWCYARLR